MKTDTVPDILPPRGHDAKRVSVIEAAAEGEYLAPDPETLGKFPPVDPFFETPQVVEQWISLGLFTLIFALLLLMICGCCRCCCRCCCGKRTTPAVKGSKKHQ